MMITKTFDSKGQMVNYYNKVRKNPRVNFCCCYLSATHGAYVVEYEYKKLS
jgi:hypothetical protein